MDFVTCYEKELKKLLIDENEIVFFALELRRFYTEDYNKYEALVNFLLAYTKENSLIVANALMNSYKSWCYYIEHNYDEAIRLATEAYNVMEKCDFKVGMARACNAIMSFYAYLGKFELSNDWGIRAVLLAEELEDDDLVFTMLINIAIGYMELEQYNRSKEILDYISNKGYSMSTGNKITYLQNIAEIEINIGNCHHALKLLSTIYEMGEDKNIDYYIPETVKLEAMAYCKLKEYQKSKELFDRACELCKQSNDMFQLCLCMYNRTKLYIDLNQYEDAYNEIKSVIEMSIKYKLLTISLKCYMLIYNICKACNNTEEALYYLEKYIAVYKDVNERKINNWHTDMNVGRVEREAKLYKILYDKTELLSSIGRDVLSSLDEHTILTIITREIQKLMKAEVFSIALLDKEKSEITYKYLDKKSQMKTKGPCKIGNNDCLADYCIFYGKDIIIKDFTKEYKNYNIKSKEKLDDKDEIIKSIIYTPMYANEKIIGIITAQDINANSYNKNDLNTLKILSNYVATAIYNATLYKDMETKAVYDELTGIYNRSEIIRLGENEYRAAQINGKPMVIAMIDTDKLKKINDKYGHVAGDAVLRNISNKMQSNIRRSDYCGKYGGDEFLLIFCNTHIDEAKIISERVRNAIESEEVVVNGKSISVSISIGLYEIEKDDSCFMSCVNKADIALYEAKKLYGNKVIKFSSLA